jgi:hypothetical protein
MSVALRTLDSVLRRMKRMASATVRFAFFLPDAIADPIEHLRIARHHRYCIAIPFPQLDWKPASVQESLAELYDFAIQTANSALDWYLENRTTKKRYAKFYHRLAYVFATIAAAIPLLKISSLLDAPAVKQFFNTSADLNSVVAELSLALFGVAAGLALIDRMAGFSADWMRYVITATQINRARLEFQFAWDKLNRTLPYPPPTSSARRAGKSAQSDSPPAARGKKPDPIATRIKLVHEFCLQIAELTEKETSGWATDLKERVSQLDSQLPRRSKG